MTEEMSEEELAHYGVKGMKWGVRRAESIAARSAPSTVKVKNKPAIRGAQSINVKNKTRGRLTTKGGGRNIASDDAVNSAVVQQKVKRSRLSSASNAELKKTVERLNLEVQYTKLTKDKARLTRGKRFVDALLGLTEDITPQATPRKAIG